MTRRFTAWVLALGVVSALPGCSWLFVDAPPPNHPERQYFTCTTSRLAPVADTVLGVTYGLSALAQFLVLNSVDTGEDLRWVALMSLGLGVGFGASAVSGYNNTSDCDDALQALHARLAYGAQGNAGPTPQPAATPTVTTPTATTPTVATPLPPTNPSAVPPLRATPVLLFTEPPVAEEPPPQPPPSSEPPP